MRFKPFVPVTVIALFLGSSAIAAAPPSNLALLERLEQRVAAIESSDTPVPPAILKKLRLRAKLLRRDPGLTMSRELRTEIDALLDMADDFASRSRAGTEEGDRRSGLVGTASTVTGTVTESVTGFPVAGELVEVYDSGGGFVDLSFTATDGSYELSGLPAGTYFLLTDTDSHFDELYDDVACPISCDPTTGTPVTVASGGSASGVDFVLDEGGVVTGTVTEAGTGFPIPDELVEIYDSGGGLVAIDFTGSDGGYRFPGLPTGTFFVLTDTDSHFDELYDDLACPITCDPTTGSAISVTFGATSSGIDFVLDEGAVVAGTVTEAGTGFPIPDELVEIYSSGGSFVDLVFTAGDGSYRFPGLPTATYFVLTDTSSHFDELYDDFPCPTDCEVTDGTPISASFGSTTSGIDFQLDSGGMITGAVTEVGSGFPIPGELVEVYDSSGGFLDLVFTADDGSYGFPGLPTGTYFVLTDTSSHFDEVYDDLPCPISCDPTSGTPIGVSNGALTTGIDFVLGEGGVIAGALTEAGTGFPIVSGIVEAYDAGGGFVDLVFTASDGGYRIPGLPSGTYFVLTDTDDYLDELYDDVSCPIGCDVTTGTPVSVLLGSTTPAIDFVLGDSAGDPLLEVVKNGSGAGTVSSTPAGIQCGSVCSSTFSVGAEVSLFAIPEYGSEFASWGGDADCTDGVVLMDSPKSCSAQFDPCSVASVVDLTAREVSSTELFEACNELRAGEGGFRVLSTGDVTLQAGNLIVLEDGFGVESGGSFRAVVSSPLP